jgi:hypothetical protein
MAILSFTELRTGVSWADSYTPGGKKGLTDCPFPATFEIGWDRWTANIAKVREVLGRYGSTAEIWITEAGYSTWRHDDRRQLAAVLDTI